jgi:hypothetical protein
MFKKFLHTLGYHKWKTVKRLTCKVSAGNRLTGQFVGRFNGETQFQECTVDGCNKVRCLVTTGNDSEQFDIGVVARAAIRNEPTLANDPYVSVYAML